MAVRHRTPTIFSIYMVDVLCCALGCVILLWQLYHAESEEQTAAAKTALSQLAKADIDLKSTSSEVDRLKSALEASDKEKARVTLELAGLKQKLDDRTRLALEKSKLVITLQSELDALREAHRAATSLLDGLKADYAALAKKSSITSADLAVRLKAHAEVLERAAGLEKRLVLLEKELHLKNAELKFATEKIDLSARRVEDAETRTRTLEKLLDELRALGKDHLAKLSVSDLQIKLLEQQLAMSKKELAVSGRRIEDLLTLRESLNLRLLASAKELSALKEAAERRFEGISLEGKKVVFLIDMSGSMVLKARGVPDRDKWHKVIETIERVATSIEPDHYQVILFSSGVEYLLKDSKRRWLAYDKATTPKAIAAALRDIKPEHGTNLHAGLEEAFTFRSQGLETIYLFSDGLPTEGPGLGADDGRLSETEQSEKLARHLRSQVKSFWNQEVAGRRVRINAIGFFFESPDLGAFLWALARENEGSFVGLSRP